MTHSTNDPVTVLQVAQITEARLEQYRSSARLHHRQAVACLAQNPPDYSLAATACHRALQFTWQADALDQLARDAGLW